MMASGHKEISCSNNRENDTQDHLASIKSQENSSVILSELAFKSNLQFGFNHAHAQCSSHSRTIDMTPSTQACSPKKTKGLPVKFQTTCNQLLGIECMLDLSLGDFPKSKICVPESASEDEILAHRLLDTLDLDQVCLKEYLANEQAKHVRSPLLIQL